jgi:hypothetical protein
MLTSNFIISVLFVISALIFTNIHSNINRPLEYKIVHGSKDYWKQFGLSMLIGIFYMIAFFISSYDNFKK